MPGVVMRAWCYARDVRIEAAREFDGLRPYATRAMRSRAIALEHERTRLEKTRTYGRQRDRLDRLIRKASLAEEGMVIRTKIRNYGDWLNPIRRERGPRR
jgi:hypothetical protein